VPLQKSGVKIQIYTSLDGLVSWQNSKQITQHIPENAVLLLLQLIVLSFEVLPFGLNKFRYVDIPGFSGFV